MRGLDRIIGQEQAVNRLREFASHFSRRTEIPDHVLLVGDEGIGKRALGRAFADELGAAISVFHSSRLEKKGDLTAVLTSLDRGDVLFVEDLHRLRQPLAQILAPALREFTVDLIIGQGVGARVHPYKLNRFACVASIHREGDLGP
jgi:holliday junction DNA helicase RuvB